VTHISFRAPKAVLDRLHELAAAHGGNRTQALRAAIVEATLPKGAEAVPDEHEVLVLLGEAARSGSVPAMRALLAHHRSTDPPVDELTAPDGLAALDELAERRC
jgi:hypothetical protein